MISISAVLPAAGSQAATAGAPVKSSAHGKSVRDLFGPDQVSGSFASLFGQQTTALASSTPSASGSSSLDTEILAQITALLKKGTPLATIVDQIAKSIASATAGQLNGAYSQSELDRIRSSITQSIANALSPPSNGPPGTAAQQAASLAARLQQLVESLARDAQNGAGQQNELSGTILDAFSAKDTPAQQKTTASPSTLDVASVVRSLLSSALTALGAPAGSPSATASAATLSVATLSTIASANAAPTAANSPTVTQPCSAPPAAPSTTPSSYGTLPVPSGSIAMSNAPDLLARMLVRAAGADTAINGSAPAAATAGSSAQSSATLTPSMLAARFAALLGENVAAQAPGNASGSSQSDTPGSGSSGHTFDAPPSPAVTNANATANLAGPVASMASQVHDAQINATPTPARVDTSALIEQMVKGMVMRTDQQGTSQIRLQLQPDNLGQVTMKLTVTGSQVSANVIAQNVDVRNVLVANQQELARTLADAG
ncbi:MAG TPA: flagellar hook-length control protein FliK, partial [Candidatus Aquilonibacter sp.]